jgi:hypothetical protein
MRRLAFLIVLLILGGCSYSMSEYTGSVDQSKQVEAPGDAAGDSGATQ